MKAAIVLCMLLRVVCVCGQTTHPVSFTYDSDGNMTARYVVTLSRLKSTAAPSDTETKEAKEEFSDVLLGEQKIVIYPNPTQGNITLKITPLDGRQKNFLRLYDSLGRLQQTIQIRQESTPLEIKGPAGIYLLDVHLGEKVSKWKIIKE